MEGFLGLMGFLFSIAVIIQWFRFRKEFNKLKIGDKITQEFSDRWRKQFSLMIVFLVAGGCFGIAAILIR
ncbi:hypothetical protein ACERII_25100 [Evansella sp. AB-rgal1]|uniref:hypothetical protein n=1 Tax=Evansella sp. AB-rgal1 TaxID=3242696 RepID=UPI00359E654C